MNGEGASQSSSASTETVRSRWSPKPEQILILESIFNSGIVNPPKDETVKIRKMLEKFGAVGDANVFYWFQNRRSRSRRRQRQLQAATTAASITRGAEEHQNMMSMHHHHQHGDGASENDMGFGSNSYSSSPNYHFLINDSYDHLSNSSLSTGGYENNNTGMENNFYAMYGHNSDHHHHNSNVASILNPSTQNSNFHYQQEEGLVTVVINGVAREVRKGAIDMKAMFGEDMVLLYSSGLPLPTDQFGFLMHSLQHGQSYFLVPRQA